ncbi:hypothetical protein IWQ60_008170 [Tieghemiomyces parasiticus]|uniref:Uncharacterized protein n=1 Tax=Tieghemiomyces parasiticus TaxID=78921 RepID=A0A9W7ZXQ0_9FUNG|nr:hypothetical protein IWQ60_008170 [Tieghemiomyces parasiticus]
MHFVGFFSVFQIFLCPIQLVISIVILSMLRANSPVYDVLFTGTSDGTLLRYTHPMLYVGIVGNFFCSVCSSTLFLFAVCYVRRWYVQIDGHWHRIVRKRIAHRVDMTCLASPGDAPVPTLAHSLSRMLLKWDWAIHRMRTAFCYAMVLVWLTVCALLYLHSGMVDCTELLNLVPTPTTSRRTALSAALTANLGGIGNVCYQEKIELAMSIFNCCSWVTMFLALAYCLPPLERPVPVAPPSCSTSPDLDCV